MKKLLGTLFGVAVFLSFFCIGIDVHAKAEDTILKGIYIDEIDVSGMTVAEAKAAVNAKVAARMETPITLKCVGENEIIITPSDLGMKWSNPQIVDELSGLGQVGNIIERYKFRKDLERENYVVNVTYSYDKELIKQIVEDRCLDFNVDAVDMKLSRSNGEFQIIEGKQGEHIEASKAVSAIYDYIMYQWNGTEASLSLPVEIENPRGTVEELKMVKDVLGSYSTSYTTSAAARVANVENGTRLLNGVTLYPGETFSTLELVTPFTEANGYAMAGSYLNGLVVDSLGGGICQVSTTLYNAVLFAELEVTQRSSHSMSVAYVPLSADAAIAESAGKDFCFINNTDYPIYIEGYTTPERRVTFNIYGVETRKEGYTFNFVTEVIETIPATTENIVQMSNQPIGYAKVQSAHTGYKAKLIKIVYDNGLEGRRETVNTSTYKMVPRTVAVGVATDNPDAYNQLQEAIATGSIDHVCNVAAALAAQVAPPAAPGGDVPAVSAEVAPEI